MNDCDHVFSEGRLTNNTTTVTFECILCGDLDVVDTVQLDLISDFDEEMRYVSVLEEMETWRL